MSAELEYEAEKKSGALAAVLNLFFPGTGYVYCGNYLLGILAFLIVVTAAVVTLGLSLVLTTPVMIIDGFLAASRANKNTLRRILKQRTC